MIEIHTTSTTVMGAVHIKVKLTNAIDEALVSRGMLAPHLLWEFETDALVDTGATYLVIPEGIVQKHTGN